jgi:hypothetical protein
MLVFDLNAVCSQPRAAAAVPLERENAGSLVTPRLTPV